MNTAKASHSSSYKEVMKFCVENESFSEDVSELKFAYQIDALGVSFDNASIDFFDEGNEGEFSSIEVCEASYFSSALAEQIEAQNR